MNVLEVGRKVLAAEAEAIRNLAQGLGQDFVKAVDLLAQCKGKVVFTGMGKSGHICRKTAATFASTGTPAFFLHPAEGVHGDLGVLARGDVLAAVSNSGETEQVIELLPAARSLGIGLISITGKPGSTLARLSDVALFASVEREACPLNLAPMSSTTAVLALGDALAAALMERKGFSADDFARCHPAGALGRRLTLKVDDIMHRGEAVPRVSATTPMRDALIEMTSKRLGFTGVFDENGLVEGIITDGDLRRALEKGGELLDLPASQVVTTRNPKAVPKGAPAIDALRLMEEHSITSLFVTEGSESRRVEGVVHIHDLVKAGLR